MTLKPPSAVYDTVECESARRLVATVIMRPELLDKVEVKPDDLYDPFLRGCLLSVRARDSAAKEVNDVGVAGDVGCSVEDVGRLCREYSSPASGIPTYNERLNQGAIRRKLCSVVSRAGSSLRTGTEPELVLDTLSAALRQVTDGSKPSSLLYGNTALDSRVDRLIDLKRRKDAGEDIRTGISTGLTQLDSYTGGVPFGVVTAEGARPKIGKSSLALQIAKTAARNEPVLYYPIEDAVDNTQDRLIAQETGIPADKLRRLNFTAEDIQRLERAKKTLAPVLSNIIFEEAAGWGGQQVVEHARKVIRANKIRLVVLDYLQVLKVGHGEDEITKVNNTLYGLLGLAKEFKVAVLALSQLSRKLEDRGQEHYTRTGEYDGYVPQVADFKWSGAIEEICKMALLLHRPAFYDQSLPDTEMHLQVALNNFGEGGQWIKFGWDGPRTQIINRAGKK